MGDDKSDDRIVKKIIGGAIFAGALYKGSKELLKKKNQVSNSSNYQENKIDVNDFPVSDSINKYGSTSVNITNGGFISRQGDYLYYAYAGSLYKSKLDDSCIEKIDDNVYPKNINAVGEYIYFSNSSGIFKISISGRTKVKLSGIPSKYMMAIDSRIFYTDESYLLHCMTTNGTEVLLPEEHGFNLNIVNDKIYLSETHQDYEPYSRGYMTNSKIYEMDLDLKLLSVTDLESIDIANEKAPVIIFENYIYYIDHSCLYRTEIKNSDNTQKLQDNVENNFTVENGFIYFGKFHRDESKKSDSLFKSLKQLAFDELHVCDGLYKMKTDGTCLTKISSENWCYKNRICIIGNYIYSERNSTNGTLKKIHINHTEK